MIRKSVKRFSEKIMLNQKASHDGPRISSASYDRATQCAVPIMLRGIRGTRLTLPSSVPLTSDRGDPACLSSGGEYHRYCPVKVPGPFRLPQAPPCAVARTA